MGLFENFPYTNFHNMNMDWIITEVKKIRTEWDEYSANMNLWKQGVDQQLATFQAWFDNLDVQEEVRVVVREMVADGTFLTVTTPTITAATESWLAAHVDPATGYVLDDTLTIQGAAADAKAAGDQITDLKSALNIGFGTSKFSIESGHNHSATMDMVILPYKTAEIFITVKTSYSAESYARINGYIGSSTTESIQVTMQFNSKTRVTIPDGVDHFGAYIPVVSSDADFELFVEYFDSNNYVIRKYSGSDLNLEFGNITITNSYWNYSASNSRVRTPFNFSVHLIPNDVVYLTDYSNAKFYTGFKRSDGTYGSYSWKQDALTITEEGDYVFLLTTLDESALSSPTELSDLFYIDHFAKHTVSTLDDLDIIKQKYGSDIIGNLAVEEYPGYITANGSHNPASADNEKYTNLFHVDSNTILRINCEYPENVSLWAVYAEYDNEKNFLRRVNIVTSGDAEIFATTIQGFSSDASYVALSYRKFDGDITIYYENNYSVTQLIFDNKNIIENEINKSVIYDILKQNINVINHRGYNLIAPENTIPAFKLSKQNGFDFVETDIRFTSDNIPVCIHDDTVDRTSNGTGLVSSFTYEQIEQLDFGSWKSAEYAGTKIPSFEEFLIFCRNVGMYPYVEVKYDDRWDQHDYATIITNIVKKIGMVKNITFISFNSDYLDDLIALMPDARYGLLTNNFETGVINWAETKKTAGYNVFINAYALSCVSYTTDINELVTNSIPLEIWTVTSASDYIDYVTGYTTDYSQIWVEIYNNSMD